MDLIVFAQNLRPTPSSARIAIFVPAIVLALGYVTYLAWEATHPQRVIPPDLTSVWPLHIEQELRGFWALTPHQPDIDDLVEQWRAWMQHYQKFTAVDQKAAFMRDRTIRLNKGDLSLAPPVVPAIRAI